MALMYALLCLTASGLNDFVFKLETRHPLSRGAFMTVVGLIWLIAGMCCNPFRGDAQANWTWGMVSGFFSFSGNVLLLESMRRLSAGIASTVYRLNLAPVAAGAVLLLGETLTPAQWGGIGLAAAAVLCFMPRGEGNGMSGALLLAVAACLLRAAMGLSYKYGFEHGASPFAVVPINALWWVAGGLIYAVVMEHGLAGFASRRLWQYGSVSGVLVSAIVVTMALGLNVGNAAVVLAIAQMSFILTFLLGVLALHEKCSPARIAGIICGIAAVLALACA